MWFCLLLRVVRASSEAAAYQAVQNQAFSQALRQQQAAAGASVIDTEIFRIVNYRMAMHYFGGGCIRDYAPPCPLGWTPSPVEGEETILCSAPADYEGPCKGDGASVHARASPEAKTEVAVLCEAEWPCKVCRKRYDVCPQRWTSEADLCKAPLNYEGVCERVVDFRNMTDFHKARWASRCTSVWPCDPRTEVIPDDSSLRDEVVT